MAADLLIEVVYILILPLYGIGGIPHERFEIRTANAGYSNALSLRKEGIPERV
jgi:hypothetical protein